LELGRWKMERPRAKRAMLWLWTAPAQWTNWKRETPSQRADNDEAGIKDDRDGSTLLFAHGQTTDGRPTDAERIGLVSA